VTAELRPGLVGEVETIVDRAQLASGVGSGTIDVFATPAMIALMEHAARACVDHLLAPGSISVGTRVDVRHIAATPPGVAVRARAELMDVDQRRLVFRVTATDPAETIGEGIHERAIVDSARLLARANAKATNTPSA
jgi:fluoroacetyl-CoA thioesterase